MATGKTHTSNYIFYYFQNYLNFNKYTSGFSFADITAQQRAVLLQKQIDNLEKRNKFLIESSGEAGEAFGKMLNGRHLEETLFQASTLSLEALPGVTLGKNVSAGSVDYVEKLVDELTKNLSTFINGLDNMIDEMYNQLHKKESLDAYAQTVIADYAKTHKVSGDAMSQQILSEFLKDGLKSIKAKSSSAEDRLMADINKCINLANALPKYKEYVKNNAESLATNKEGAESRFFRILSRRLTGIRSHAQGLMGEIAVAAGFAAATSKGLKEIGKLGTTTSNVVGTRTSVKLPWGHLNINILKDPQLEEDAAKAQNIKKSTNKKDVEVTMNIVDGNGKITSTFTYGANVKNYTIKPDSPFTTYTIHDSGTFANAYKAAFPQDANYSFLFNLGAGHANQLRLGGPSYSELNTQWTQIIRTVAVSYIATALAGGIRENTVFLVLNGRVFLITDVLKNILSFIQAGEPGYNESNSAFGYGYQLRGMSREKMLAKSTWIFDKSRENVPKNRWDDRNTQLAYQRSDKARLELPKILNDAKITISLRTMTSLLMQR